MESIWDNIKNAFKRPDNGHIQLIIINVAVFLLSLAVYGIGSAAVNSSYGYGLYRQIFTLQPDLMSFLEHPWGLITYFFSHSLGITHILFNMVGLYFFGKVFVNYMGQRRLINLYVLGGIAGGIAFLVLCAVFPSLGYVEQDNIVFTTPLVGASASVMAIAAGLATLAPNLEFALYGLFRVKVKWIVLFFILMSYINIVTSQNVGGEIAHLGGVFIGWYFVYQYKRQRDIGKWISSVLIGFQSMFSRKPNMRASYGGNYSKSTGSSRTRSSKSSSRKSTSSTATNRTPTQDEIDEILDKIAKSGYSSLSAEEKKMLFQASNDK